MTWKQLQRLGGEIKGTVFCLNCSVKAADRKLAAKKAIKLLQKYLDGMGDK